MEFKCSECGDGTRNVLFEAWIRSKESLNPWAKGTATAGLLQLRCVCADCLRSLKELGLTEAEFK